MKAFLRKLVLLILRDRARARLSRFKGKIVAVTGSLGKTSTKEAIYTVLNSRFRVKKSPKSMNSEFGLPLTILDIESGYNSATKWTWFLMKGLVNSFRREYAEVLLLELGVDKPGDMDFLISLVKPDIAVMTNVSAVHMAEGQFEHLEAIFEEKSKMVKASKMAIVNLDNEFTERLARRGALKKTEVTTFSVENEADFRAEKISWGVDGLHFILVNNEKKYEVSAGVLGQFQVYVLLPAIACGRLLGMEMSQIIEAIGRYKLPPGRMSIIEGIEESTILDSSYNSSPGALKEALFILKEMPGRRVAVLGNMNELGKNSETLHRKIAEIIPDCCDLLLTVGEEARLFAENLETEKFRNFKNAEEATAFYKEEVRAGDVILVKGSQNKVRLERFVKALMAHPEDAKTLLVRQEKNWEEI